MNINSIYCESLSRISSKMFNSDTSTTKKDESGGRRSKRQLKRLDSGPEKSSGRRTGSILIAHAQHKQQIKYQARAGVIVNISIFNLHNIPHSSIWPGQYSERDLPLHLRPPPTRSGQINSPLITNLITKRQKRIIPNICLSWYKLFIFIPFLSVLYIETSSQMKILWKISIS